MVRRPPSTHRARRTGRPRIAVESAPVARLRADAPRFGGGIAAAVTSAVPAFTESHNAEVAARVHIEVADVIDLALDALDGGAPDVAVVAERHAAARADQHLPIEAMLLAHRALQRALVEQIRTVFSASLPAPVVHEAVAAAAERVLELVDELSAAYASAHVRHRWKSASDARDRRSELLGMLLEGCDESDGRAVAMLREAGLLDGRRSICVGVARPSDPGEMLQPGRAARLVDAIEDVLQSAVPRRLIDVRAERAVFVLSDLRRVSGYAPAARLVSSRAAEALRVLGPAVHVGLSEDVSATARIPHAFREATIALELAGPDERIVRFGAVSLRRMMLHVARRDLRAMLPAWAGAYAATDAKLGGALGRTLRAYAAANLNALEAARALGVHPNTVHARFRKVEDVTGLDPRCFERLNELLLVADLIASA